MTLPNMITIFRLILVPVFWILFKLFDRIDLCIIVFMVAGVSDVLDGYLARKLDQITKLGTMLDPLADKLMNLSLLLMLSIKNIIPQWIFIIILLKEILMIGLGIYIYLFKIDWIIPSNIFGKIATASLYIYAVSWLIFKNDFSYYLLIMALVFNIIAFLNYGRIFLKLYRARD
ncbi:MAG: CDP-alcohol phosphatidyltransferase family protein [Tissierellia bacterium]|nr:CDP-alcohol phosphatidyltransferase family protein [Tissierellia bacterium]